MDPVHILYSIDTIPLLFENNLKSGFGKLFWKNGSKYEGNFEMDIKQGNGTFTDTNGTSYTGTFENDFIKGETTVNFTNGNQFTGILENGEKSGHGIFVWASGILKKILNI